MQVLELHVNTCKQANIIIIKHQTSLSWNATEGNWQFLTANCTKRNKFSYKIANIKSHLGHSTAFAANFGVLKYIMIFMLQSESMWLQGV